MKKILLLVFSLVLVVALSACGDKENTNKDPVTDSGNNANENVDPDNNVKDNADNDATNNAENNTDKAENNQNNNQTSENEDNNNSAELADFEEAKLVEEHIDDLDELQVVVETDNPNKRIILYKDGNKVQYKSIFIKDDQHLKIINTHDEGKPLFNDRIK